MVIATKHQEVIVSLKEQVLAEFADEVHSMTLFGSVARGDANADSDIDILIITDATLESERRINEISTDIDLENEVFTQLVFFKTSGFKSEVGMRSWFSSDIITEGIVLYDDGTYRGIRDKDPRSVTGVPRR